MSCSRIQEVLFDYLAHELGDKRSMLVREHLRHCRKCREEAAKIQTTLSILRRAAPPAAPERLSRGVWLRLERALLHPFRDWIFVHRRLTVWSIVLLFLILVFIFAHLSRLRPETVTYWFNLR